MRISVLFLLVDMRLSFEIVLNVQPRQTLILQLQKHTEVRIHEQVGKTPLGWVSRWLLKISLTFKSLEWSSVSYP